MANDSQRDKARSMFGSAFMEAAKAAPPPKNYATGQQKIAQARPIPTYKVGGPVKKAESGMPRARPMPYERGSKPEPKTAKVPDRVFRGESARGDDAVPKPVKRACGGPVKKAQGGVQTSADTARKLATEMGGMKDGGMSPITGMEPGKYAVGGAGKMRKGMAPIKRAAGGAAKVRKGMMSPDGKITAGVKPHKGIGGV
jgi:hypothetical protein